MTKLKYYDNIALAPYIKNPYFKEIKMVDFGDTETNYDSQILESVGCAVLEGDPENDDDVLEELQ